jgi:hypothetical protein
MTTVMAILATLLVGLSTAAFGAESSLKCAVNRQMIDQCVHISGVVCGAPPVQKTTVSCSVTADETVIGDVVVNRGQCASPSMSADERALLAQVPDQAQLAAGIQRFKTDPGQRALLTMMVTTGFDLQTRQPMTASKRAAAVAMLHAAVDPAGTYHFGGQFSFDVCDNILEYTISADGNPWTWQVQ